MNLFMRLKSRKGRMKVRSSTALPDNTITQRSKVIWKKAKKGSIWSLNFKSYESYAETIIPFKRIQSGILWQIAWISMYLVLLKVQHDVEKKLKYEKKMPGFGTNNFSLCIPKGLQKYPNENIPCVSWREIHIFRIYVLKKAWNLLQKCPFSAFKRWWLKVWGIKSKMKWDIQVIQVQ